ncbi:MAG TPA: ABC transporter permease [Gammaproteobacteria bacterium]
MNRFSFCRLRAIVLKELRQLRRDRLTFAMIVGIPTLQLLLFGYAINYDVRHLDAAIVDQAATAHSRELIAELTQSQLFDFHYRLRTPAEADQLLREGRITAALVIPVDFEHRLAQREEAVAQLMVDGSDQVVQQSARQLAAMPVGAFLSGVSTAVASGEIAIVNYYNPQRIAAINSVPGLIGMILTMTMVLFTAIALVREREHGNLEFLIATPLSSLELTVGKVLPFIGIGLLQTTLVVLIGTSVFGVPLHGSLLSLYGAALLFIVAALALGVFISTLARSQFQAMQMAFFTFLPQILLSGFMFPFAGMPRPAQLLAELFPLTHFNRIMRGIMLRGATLADVWPELVALLLFALVMLTLATLRFHKRLD